jgi:hypothetical protein
MKALLLIVSALLLSACSGYPYTVKDGGDGVYYAESPPTYTYVDGFYGFPYYGPYRWSWYYPVWYAPLPGPHYSWYRPYHYWCHPFQGVPVRYAVHEPAAATLPTQAKQQPPAPGLYPVLPTDLRSATVGPNLPRYSLKSSRYSNPTVKSRMAAKWSKPTYGTSSRSTSPTYRSAPRASSRTVTSQRSVRQPARRIE